MEHATLHVIIFLSWLALAFDFSNGFHDAANSIATVVSTGVLKPQFAVVFAAFFNFAAYFIFPLHVAATIGKGTIDASFIDLYVIFGALAGGFVLQVVEPHLNGPGGEVPILVYDRSEEHTSELQSLMRISYAVFCLKKKK